MMIIHVLMPIVLLALLLPASSYALAPLQHVVLTYSSRSIASIDLYVAQERGFFRDEGLDAQLVQVRATAAIAAIVSGEVHALGSIGSAIRAIPRGAPIKVLAVSLRRPVFWLVSRPELKSFNDLKGKVMGTTTIGGSQHTAGVRLLRKAGQPRQGFDRGLRRRCADAAPGVGERFDSGRHSFTADCNRRAR
jgi:ABC-type nitrate/sulfonate/bicarbonate transport system substrate-binding protein